MKCVVCQERPAGANAGTLRWCGRCRRSWFADLKHGDGMLSLWAATRARRYERRRNAERVATVMRLVDDVRERLAQVEDERDRLRRALGNAHTEARGVADDDTATIAAGLAEVAEARGDEVALRVRNGRWEVIVRGCGSVPGEGATPAEAVADAVAYERAEREVARG